MSQAAPAARRRVLYIEDDAALGRLMQRRLDRAGYDVTVATDGAEGVREITRSRYDIVALDHYLPGMDGIAALGEIAQLSDPPPVVYVTGSDDSRVAVAALKAGAADYVFKDSSDNFFTLFIAAIEQALAQVELRHAKEAADEALRQAKEKAEQASREKSRLLAATGHDLKQPLSVIAMAVDRLAARADERLHPTVQRADRALDTLARAFDALLQAARLESGVVAPRVGRVHMAPVLDELAQEWMPRAAEKGLRLRLVATEIEVETDSEMLRTILRNMIGNAIKYTDAGGIVVGCRRRGAQVLVQVTDTGIGISTEALPTIYEEFRQIDPGSRGGLGLGLSIVRGTAEALGHELIVNSRLGKGSTFGVIVPLAAAAEAEA